MSEVPEGTVSEVLDWVGDDPDRADLALQAEYAGQNRSTLISQLEAIAVKEATDVSETTAETTEEPELAPGPEPPEVEIDPTDTSTTVLTTVVRDPEVDFEEERDEEGNIVLPEATAVETIGGAVAPHGCILVINGQAFAFSPQMTASLRAVVNHAIAGVVL